MEQPVTPTKKKKRLSLRRMGSPILRDLLLRYRGRRMVGIVGARVI